MLKNYFIIFILFLSTSVVAQPQRIDDGSWYLYNLIINSEDNLNPLDVHGNPVVSNFSTIDGLNHSFMTTFCDTVIVGLIYDSNDNTFAVSGVGMTLGCGPPDTPLIEINFTNFFRSEVASMGVFIYEIVEENLDTPKTLTITAPNGDKAIYTRTLLSAKAFSKSVISLYPNPVKNELTLISSNKSQTFNVVIRDLAGKQIISQKLQGTNTFNTEKLVSGLYFISIEDAFGNRFQKKFIKE